MVYSFYRLFKMPKDGLIDPTQCSQLLRAEWSWTSADLVSRLHRGFQRTVLSGVPERELVPVPGGRCREGGILAKRLQWREATQRLGKPLPQGVCCVGNNG